MQELLNLIKNLGNLKTINSHRIEDSVAMSVVGGAKTNIISSYKEFVLCVCNDSISALKLVDDIRQYGKNTVNIPSKDEVLVYNKAFSKDVTFQRLSALYDIINGKAEVAVITVEGLSKKFPSVDKFTESVIVINKGENYDIDILIRRLVYAGYKREIVTEGKGQFAVRGDILDIFPVNSENPVRIDFFDTTVEKIKYFEAETGKSYEETEQADIAPATDIFIYDDEVPFLIESIKKSYKNLKVDGEHKKRADDICNDLIRRIENGEREFTLNFVMPFIEGEYDLKQYLPQNSRVIFEDSKLLSDKAELVYKEHETRYLQLLTIGEILPESYNQYIEKDLLFSQFEGLPRLTLNALNNTTFYTAKALHLKTSAIRRYALNFKELCTDISNWLFGGYRVYICCKNQDGINELKNNLSDAGYFVATDVKDTKNAIALPINITEGFVSHENKFVLIGYLDIFIKSKNTGLKRKKKDIFLSPEIGDYIVHQVHGIGVCKGIQNLKTGNTLKDYIVIEYNGGDILYVPCDQMNLIAKYSGSDTLPKLNKLGGKEFEKIKQRVKNYIREMAFDLKKLYAERENRKGYAFSPDSPMQKEFEDAFEFDETEDQIKSAQEIKKDMESPFIMDRLLCGDVGYGKTEVALRAVFKAILDGKQTAILAPTTILSQQHYNLCLKRFNDFGIRIDVINRFRSPKEQEDILQRLSEGKIDLIIGTHRLLSKDIKFKDLGLLVVDEEQRFGVEDKEKIKNINTMVDVLTLSATPIPRTLHMSLSGIRDISVLDTPPLQRLPIQTYVLEYSEGLIIDSISRELSRGGQVFILYNRVDSIETFAYKISSAMPQAKVITAHGQMKEDNLELAIEKFYLGKADVLICTTIIENGIDIPNVNTLIVYEADRLGLSQLYQLRGRVGRGNRLAHVYFTYIPEKVLTENAYKRLKAIMEYTEFGSGFKIAMRDLEIRGAGNVLGRQQHGHIENVGYDMYLRLLKQSMTDEIEEEDIACEIVLDAYVPEKYVEDNGQRMKVYQRISSMEIAEKQELENELTDIYGQIPQPVNNLINIRLIKLLAGNMGAEAVTIKPQIAKITLKSMETLKSGVFMDAIEYFSEHCNLSFLEKPEVVFKHKRLNSVKVLDIMADFCKMAVDLSKVK